MKIVLRLFGVRPVPVRQVTEEEIRSVIAAGAESGAIRAAEREMIEEILFLADRAVRTIMTARPDVSWIDLDDSKESVLRKVRECSHTQLLVSRGSIDEIVGVVDKQNLLDQALDSRPFDIEVALQAPLIVHEGATILRTLDLFKKTPAHTAVIIDEYGIVQGLVTRTDLLEAIAGDLADLDIEAEPKVTRRDDGSLLIDATMPIGEVAELLGIRDLSSGDFLTLAGFVLFRLRPCAADRGAFHLVGTALRSGSDGGPADRQSARAACAGSEASGSGMKSALNQEIKLTGTSGCGANSAVNGWAEDVPFSNRPFEVERFPDHPPPQFRCRSRARCRIE